MPKKCGVLLTGATGLLGQYLLRDLLQKHHKVTAIVRDLAPMNAKDRIAEIISFWCDQLRLNLPLPTIITSELGQGKLDIGVSDRRWISNHCQSVIHSAANVSFQESLDGQPWRTNVDGTRSLLELATQTGIREWHQISTAFVCGKQSGHVIEDDSDSIKVFQNIYEESKWEAEQLVRGAAGLRSTIYRPSIIVGDRLTGHTSNFHGLYRFLELAVRLSASNTSNTPLRLPVSGDETWNLVTVDWVSQAIVQLASNPDCHGKVYHLVSPSPVSTRFIRGVACELLNLRGIEFRDDKCVSSPNRMEQLFLNGVREYWPYLYGNPEFSSANIRSALPNLPSPEIDQETLQNLIRFAVANHWGRSPRPKARSRSTAYLRCANYIERTFPERADKSDIARETGLDISICIELIGAETGQWTCRWSNGELLYTRPGREDNVSVDYRTDLETFDAIIHQRQTPQEAFFEQRLTISGDLESGLKLAFLFGQFLMEEPDDSTGQEEESNVHCLTP